MDIISFYTSIIEFAGMNVDDAGLVRYSNEEKKPWVVSGKVVLLPTTENLRNYNGEQSVIFHPLSEQVVRGESPVIERLKHAINANLSMRFANLGAEILRVVASPSVQSKMTPEQMAVILGIKSASESTANNWTAVALSLMQSRPDRSFVNIHLRRGGHFHEKQYARVGITVFPYYRALAEGTAEEFGKIRKADIPTFTQLHQAVFPEIDMEEAYNFGLNGTTAPYFLTLLNTAAQVAFRINDVVELLQDFLTAPTEFMLSNVEWYNVAQAVETLQAFARQVPVQEGNDGVMLVKQPEEPKAGAVYQPAAMVTPAPAAQPVQAQPVQPVAQPVYQQPYAGHPGAYQPGQPLQPVQPPPGPELYTPGGINFKAVAAMNPNIGYGPNALGAQLMAQQNEAAALHWQQANAAAIAEQQRQNMAWAAATGQIPPGMAYPGGIPPGYDPRMAPPPGYVPPGYAPQGYMPPGYGAAPPYGFSGR